MLSGESISQAKTWVDNCINNHPLCPGPETVQLPKRIIKIIDADNLQLQENEASAKAMYSALSYVWGRVQTFATTLSTIESQKTGFLFADLPKTLQDAVSLTRQLGLEYIWIDSICIIQDSLSDRDVEIPKMSQYYSSSYITISAAIAESVEDGFLGPRDECEHHPDACLPKDLMKLPYICPAEEGKDKQAVGEILFREDSPYRLCDEPISKRAWTLQESVLAPRILSYGTRLLWQCHEGQWGDGGIDDWSFDQQSSGHRRIQQEYPARNARKEGAGLGEVYDAWQRIVHEYSYRHVTFPTDRLPALSGLATEYAKISGNQYLAGLWRGNLLRDLMWSTYPTLVLHRTKKWRAPSWSWASVENAITFDKLSPAPAIEMAEVLDCTVTPRLPSAPFGEITAATLKIRGFLATFTEDDPSGYEMIKRNLKRELECPDVAIGEGGVKYRREMLNMLHQTKEGESEGEWVPPKSMSLLVMFARPVEGDTVERYTQGRQMKAVGSLEDLWEVLEEEREKQRKQTEEAAKKKRMAEVVNEVMMVKKEVFNRFLRRALIEKLPEGAMKEHVMEQAEDPIEGGGEDFNEEEKDAVLAAMETIDWEHMSAAFRPPEQTEGHNGGPLTPNNEERNTEPAKDTDPKKETEDSRGTEAKSSNSTEQTEPRKEHTRSSEAEKSNPAPPTEASSTTEPPQISDFKDDKALASCLVLVKQEDGRYERIAALQTLPVAGISNMRKRMQVVEIV